MKEQTNDIAGEGGHHPDQQHFRHILLRDKRAEPVLFTLRVQLQGHTFASNPR